MRTLLARALSRVPWTRRRPGRHSAKHLVAQRAAVPEPEPVSPWGRPWTSPSAADVRAIFRDPQTLALPTPQRERVWAAAFAEIGVDYDHPAAEPLASLVSPSTPARAAA
ncbi:hypothetical protein RCO28_19005 [Streptomyces sp. LHD-70]|uniref:hypothetical protein n=1 Tax=Streptomyces sp. LHD-70 TaxID=3072140 RepID=UPI00280E9710|nr:hypothetical protein [Streptomyces sp. LHD-70]MDQ8704562.1 hypothetical protein [Streptomyces sp. LHD-70]